MPMRRFAGQPIVRRCDMEVEGANVDVAII